MSYLFTSESVSEGHPDKVADQISDAVLDAALEKDPYSRVAVETLVTTGLVLVAGEMTTETYVDVEKIARRTIREIGYTDPALRFDAESCAVLTAIHEQSENIKRGVDTGGAGDQGIMFGYACRESESLMPLPIMYAHGLVRELASIRKHERIMPYLRPDAKSQVTIEYEDDRRTPRRIHTVVVSTQHNPGVEQADIEADIRAHLLPRVIDDYLLDDEYILHVNPTGEFEIGGPHGDAGLTGRKIIVDTYGGKGAHGGGAFSGKDATKVDRSGAYAARHIAKNIVQARLAEEVEVQISYAIGVEEPVSVALDTKGTGGELPDRELAAIVRDTFDLRPAAIIERFDLRKPQYLETAAYGHFGRSGFAWEETDCVDMLKDAVGVGV
ncbi:MAG: methionine adenosyltransferase [Bacteroidetes bacterium SB0662_bin_6]|nr:methionine adenosyltransferase [Bacteroidetes bacterium SB0668_bin_1]MYE04053.1 methionine adenosyltransferase [Bacteroidetes bacterium SB0662_bin_6]